MKQWIAFSGIVLLGVAAVWVSEHRKVDVPAGPAAVLYLVGDTEQELTRMPVRFTRTSDEEEISTGDELAKAYSWTGPNDNFPEFPEVEAYLNQVGTPLAAQAHRKLPYKFHYLPDRSMVNAFALPGGHVFVGAGLLALMDSEDELAAVMGHEIEHIDHYHCAERVQQEQALRRLPLGELIAMPVEVFEAGYSKDQELEADREGTRLAVQAGYSANGAIRMFETFERLYQEYQTHARSPQEELSDVAQQTISGYFRSHPLPSERIEQIRKLIATEHWQLKPERDLAVAYVFWTAKASAALEIHRYQDAEQLALRSLKLHDGQQKALEVLARAQFAQADFSGASNSYRKLLDLSSTAETAKAYAESLAAADRPSAAAEFRRWVVSAKAESLQGTNISQAGLDLLAGNPAIAHQLESEFRNASQDARVPVELGALGWWFYRAGDYQSATNLLGDAVQQRPGDEPLGIQLAWSDIEVHRNSDALVTLSQVYEQNGTKSDKIVARAVAEWQAQQPDQALRDFDAAVAGQPEWENFKWVNALYSSRVVSSIREMQAERDRRRRQSRTQR
jgi:predicted Zn-dependent protease